jgi:hypothetical protein
LPLQANLFTCPIDAEHLKVGTGVDNHLTEPENQIRELDSPPIKKTKSSLKKFGLKEGCE